MVKKSADRFSGVRIQRELKDESDKIVSDNKELKKLGIHSTGDWVQYLLRREIDRYCIKKNSKS